MLLKGPPQVSVVSVHHRWFGLGTLSPLPTATMRDKEARHMLSGAGAH